MAAISQAELGKIIKQKAAESGIKPRLLASKIGRSVPQVYVLYKTGSIDVRLLAKLSEVLRYNFLGHFVPEQFLANPETESAGSMAAVEAANKELEAENKQLKNENELMRQLLEKALKRD